MDLGRVKLILNVDSIGGIAVGLLVFLLHDVLVWLYDLPLTTVLLLGAANLGYGLFSGSLALFARMRDAAPPRPLLLLLVTANCLWPLVCVGLIVSHWPAISWLGVVSVALEGIYVGALGIVEARIFRFFRA